MKEQMQNFYEKGWMVLDLSEPDILFSIKRRLEKELQRITSTSLTLENYHEKIVEDEQHTSIQIALTQFFRNKQFALEIFKSELPFLKQFLGQDILV